MPWLRRAALPVSIVAAVLLFHGRAARPGRAFAEGDLQGFFLASRTAAADHLRHLDLSSWERGIFMGYPLVGDPQAALFDPVTWLTLHLDPPRALTVATLLHLVVMGLGMAFWVRLRGLGAVEALLAAILFALGAKQTAHLQHWNFAASTAWWPWMLASIEGFALDGRRRWLWGLAVSGALAWFGGSPQMAYFGTLIAGAYGLVVLPAVWTRRRGDVLRLAIALAAGLVLAAPLLFPVAELAAYGPRGESGLGYAFATSFKWPSRWALALLVLPRAYTGEVWPWSNLWEATGYLGLLTLGLVAAAPLRRRGVLPLLVVLVVGVWISFGEDAWLGLHRLFYELLPGYGKFRVPTRALMVSSFLGAVLAAEGLHALRSDPGVARTVRAAVPLVVALVAALVLPRLRTPYERTAIVHAGHVASALALGSLAWVAAGTRWRTRLPWALAALALVVTDLYVTFGRMNAVSKVSDLRPHLAALAPYLPPVGEPRRLAAFAYQYSNDPQRLRWEGTAGYGPTVIERVRRLIEATRHGRLGEQPAIDLLLPIGDASSPFWPLLATPFVVTVGAEAGPDAVVPPSPPPLVALRRVAALPRIYWAGAWMVHDDAGIEAPLRAAAAGDRVVLASEPSIPPGTPAGPVPATAVTVGRDRLEASVVAPADGVVVVVDPWFPGWSARVDGAPAPLLRANYAFQAVPVKAGAHRLELRYRNPALRRGALLALAGVVVLAVATARFRRPGRPPASARARSSA